MSVTYAATSLADGLAALNKGTKKISFGNCSPKLGDEGVSELVRTLKKHEEVYWLGLFDQEITPYGLDSMIAALKTNKSLTHLDLGRNPLGDEGIKALCNFLAANKTIIEVYLWETGMTEEGAKCLELMLLKNRVIQNLDINDNPAVPQQLKSSIAGLVKQGASRVPASPRAGPMKLAQ